MSTYNTSGIQGSAGTLFGTGRVGKSDFQGDGIFGEDYFNSSQDGRAAFGRFSDRLGGTNPFKNFVLGKYNIMRDKFAADTADDPTLTWTNFLTGSQDKLATDYQNMGPRARFEQPGRQLGKLRWL